MFIDLDVVPENWCEVCIVGAGPIGLSLALTLARKGFRALILESGVDRPCRQVRDLSTLGTYNRDHHHSSDATVVRAVGGTSLRWGGRCVAYDDIDFERRPQVPEGIWPIDHATLRPFYPAARTILSADYSEDIAACGDSGFNYSRESWARVRSTARANYAELQNLGTLAVVTNCTAIRMHLDTSTDRLSALTCVSRGRTRNLAAPYFVFAAGGRENTRLLLELQRKGQRLFAGVGGPLGRYYMGHLTGEIAVIGFASASKAAPFQFKAAASGTVIRDRFQPSASMQGQHRLLNIALWADSLRPDEVIRGNGAASLFHVLRHMRRAQDPIFRHSVSAGGVLGAHVKNVMAHPMQTALGSSRMLARKFLSAERYPQFSIISPSNTYLLRYHAEHSPSPRSRVTLSEKTDAHGCHRLDVDFRYAPDDFRSVLNAHYLLAEWLRQTGSAGITFLKPPEQLEEWIAAQAIDGYHQIGLTRMSTDRKSGIVNIDCRTHDIPNLFVAGSSVFPTSGQANPTLPAVALSLRLAAHLANQIARDRAPQEIAPT